ncbi:hypothetical protein [Psychrobacter sp. ASPA161_9]|uniref:hypothetical protein n=1 Tax=Psychrobacter sp. ASPA161_9 TaxID=3160961 RepID=UPI003F813D81
MLNQAINVFDFLKIKYPDRAQRMALYYLPAISSCIISAIVIVVSIIGGEGSNFLFSNKFNDLLTLIAILPGFYIAALSAVSAINRDAVDNIINPNSPPTIKKKEPNRAEYYDDPLTRRVFLSMLFAYLATLSLLLAIFLIFIRFLFSLKFLESFVHLSNFTEWSTLIFTIINFVVFFLITQLIVLTLVGVNYLGYKALVDG